MPLLLRSTHCRGRNKVEKYSSSEVPESDNNSIKESVEFSEPSFRMNFAESLLKVASETELQNPHLLSETGLLIFHFLFGSHFKIERERGSPSDFLLLVCCVVFLIENSEHYL